MTNKLDPRMMLALSQVPDHQWSQLLYAGYGTDWTEDEIGAFERLSKADRRRAVRGHLQALSTPSPELPRQRRKKNPRDARLRKRRHVPGLRYVRRHALDPFLDPRLSKGARTTLIYLLARCGRRRQYRAATCWVAEDLACSTRSIQRHYVALQAAGYLVKSDPDKRGVTTVYLTPACEPPPFKKQRDSEAQYSAQPATKMSATESTREEKEAEKGDAPSCAGIPLESGSEEPGAELPGPAQPLVHPLAGCCRSR